MPRPLGADRLETLPQGRLVLLARHDKGWHPRLEKTLLTPEHPGTAVLWEEQLFEVRSVEAASGEVRYTLALWDERHTIRVAETYDLANEDRRRRERELNARRERERWVALLFAPLLGCLPAKVQECIEREIAIPSTRMTFLSAMPLLLFGTLSLLAMLIVVFGGPALLPTPIYLAGLYFWLESLGRLWISMALGRAAGLLPVELAWGVWRLRAAPSVDRPPPFSE